MATNRRPLDARTFTRVQAALEFARRTGMDRAEALHRVELVLSPAARLDIQKTVLGRLVDQISTWQPHEMLRRRFKDGKPATPADMYTVMVEFIEEFKNSLEQ